MCQATVVLVQDGEERVIMRDVILLMPQEDGLRLQALFEEPVIVKAEINRIDFLNHTVTLAPREDN